MKAELRMRLPLTEANKTILSSLLKQHGASFDAQDLFDAVKFIEDDITENGSTMEKQSKITAKAICGNHFMEIEYSSKTWFLISVSETLSLSAQAEVEDVVWKARLLEELSKFLKDRSH